MENYKKEAMKNVLRLYCPNLENWILENLLNSENRTNKFNDEPGCCFMKIEKL
jgi:hypothetical protein